LEIRCKQLLIHGAEDDIIPVAMSRSYVKQKLQKHESANLLEIPKVGHFEIVDPESKAWPVMEKALVRLV
jgi:pimeloyl-ACP methyl ester carboxylesterase